MSLAMYLSLFGMILIAHEVPPVARAILGALAIAISILVAALSTLLTLMGVK